MIAWCNGALIDPEAPAVSVLDHGFTVGDGVFEAVKVVDNQPFALTRHLDRLAPVGAWPRASRAGRRPHQRRHRRGAPGAAHRAGAGFGSRSPPVSRRWARIELPVEPTLVVVATDAQPYPPVTKVVTVPWPRNERGAMAGLKTTAYAENVVALAYAAERGGSEAIFANLAGNLCEGTGANVFCVFDGRVATPPLSCGCLAGITRELLVEWCDVEERDISMAEFAQADEVFLASTTRDVQAVSHVDDRELGDHFVTVQDRPGMADERAARRRSLSRRRVALVSVASSRPSIRPAEHESADECVGPVEPRAGGSELSLLNPSNGGSSLGRAWDGC
ncbi:MAG: aminotransferase class IV [Nocardioidaceae bacterium]